MLATIRRSFVAAGLVASMTLIAACGGGGSATGSAASTSSRPAAAFPVTLHTASGSVVVPSRPAAIVSLSPTATEMLYAIGAGGQVKAVDQDSNFPAGAPKTDLSALQLNMEALVALKPDLVVISNPVAKLTAEMKKLSVPVLLLPAAGKIGDVYAEMTELGEATGHVPQAKSSEASIRTGLQHIVSSVPHRSTPLTYYYELTTDYYSITSDTFVGHLLQLIGLKSIADSASGAAKSGGYPQLSAEFIVKANPDYVFLADTICCQQTPAKVAQRPGWAQLTAVRSHRVVPLNDDVASRWGPRIVQLLRTVADAVRQNGG